MVSSIEFCMSFNICVQGLLVHTQLHTLLILNNHYHYLRIPKWATFLDESASVRKNFSVDNFPIMLHLYYGSYRLEFDPQFYEFMCFKITLLHLYFLVFSYLETHTSGVSVNFNSSLRSNY